MEIKGEWSSTSTSSYASLASTETAVVYFVMAAQRVVCQVGMWFLCIVYFSTRRDCSSKQREGYLWELLVLSGASDAAIG
jgi:hypothetical protein